MARSRALKGSTDPGSGLGFLLSQVGAHSAATFADRLGPLGLNPPHVGILRVVEQADGLSQQALGEKLGMFPSRLVQILDDLEKRGLVERRDNPSDRRSYALHLTDAGRETLAKIEVVTQEHRDALVAALDESERAQLAGFLSRIAAEQKLQPGIHPGMRKQGPPSGQC
ncbi:MarR family winged helix-turn-helix transcriptional regulator [Singulisphaera sp. PoT]|uniref:MarR family winged helix-turn-helix transcriptional regulator n=1 Tax=Singulisphaera sp. PoT TaxID=3411797 RepID=UPI003BF463E9